MEHINLDSSDDGVTKSQSVMIVPDSEEEKDEMEIMKNIVDVVEIDDVEEGELDVEAEPVDDLLFEIKFKNVEIFKRFSSKVVSALTSAFQHSSDEAIQCDISAQTYSVLVQKTGKRRSVSKELSPDFSGLKELFTIDASPSVKPEFEQIPSYKRNIKNVLEEESEASKRQKIDEANACKPKRHSANCFNCGSNEHSLRDCPKPRNLKRITNARRAFTRVGDKRYHADLEQQYQGLRPGVISEKLRKALGMRSGELPFFFYRMRVLGYPPGWLEDAKVAHSGLSLITSDGTKDTLSNAENNAEENDKYDVSKIIDFPGFNSKPTGKFYDDYKFHNVPPMNEQHMKEEFIKGLGSSVIKGYKRKKMIDVPEKQEHLNDNVCLEPADMELEDADEVQTIAPPPPPPPLPPNPPLPAEPASNKNERPPSPTLADLEAQQEELLKALQSDPDLSLEITAPPFIENIPLPATPTIPTTQSLAITPLIKDSQMGTPLLKFSPYDKLPAGENFKVGVSDVINFENLPDSTGKYEQMKVVIKKVRNIVTQLNKEDDETATTSSIKM